MLPVPVHAGRQDVADLPVVDPLHRLDVAGLVAPLGAGHDREALVLRLLGRVEHLADAGHVHADRLLGEDVLAGLDGRLEVDRAEARRGGQDDVVDLRQGQELLVRVEAVEDASRWWPSPGSGPSA